MGVLQEDFMLANRSKENITTLIASSSSDFCMRLGSDTNQIKDAHFDNKMYGILEMTFLFSDKTISTEMCDKIHYLDNKKMTLKKQSMSYF